MIPGDPHRSDDPEVVDIEKEDPTPVLEESAILALEESFGKGTTKRKMLVTKGVTLSQLHKMSK